MRYILRLMAALTASIFCTACVATTAPVSAGQSVRAAQTQTQTQTQTQAVPARPSGGKPIVILNDSGGNVLQTVARREELGASGRPVEVRGYCRSACTLYITLPNACLAPDATVGFHAPRLPGTTIIPPLVDQIMADYYRNGIRQKWMSEWRHSLKMVRISAGEYVRLDPQTRLCPR